MQSGGDFRSGGAAENKQLHLFDEVWRKGLVGDVLVVAAANENNLFVKAGKPRDGAGGACGNTVIVPFYALKLPHKLYAVFNAAEALCDAVNDLHGNLAPNGGYGGEVVFHIVHTGNFNIRLGEQLGEPAVLTVAEHAVLPQECAVFHGLCMGEPAQLAAHKLRHARSNHIVRIEHGDGEGVLVAENIALRLDIFLHVLVNVKVIRRNVRNNRNLRGAAHGDELKAGKLHNGAVLVVNFLNNRQQCAPDIAALVNGFARSGEEFGNEGGGGGLAVGAGHAVLFAGAEVEENLHFTGDGLACAAQGAERGGVPVHARRAENHVRVNAVKVAFAEQELRPRRLKLRRRGAEFFPARLVPRLGVYALFGEQLYDVLVADAYADKGDLFLLHFVKEFFRVSFVHIITSQKGKLVSGQWSEWSFRTAANLCTAR